MSALEGIRIVDFSKFLPGPIAPGCSPICAEVIRIENPREIAKQAKVFGWDKFPTMSRRCAKPIFLPATSARHARHRRREPQQAIRRWSPPPMSSSEDYRPGVLEGIGLGYGALKAVRPDLIYTSSPLRADGSLSRQAGTRPNRASPSRVLSRVGENPDAPSFSGIRRGCHHRHPRRLCNPCRVRDRDRTGQGQHDGRGHERLRHEPAGQRSFPPSRFVHHPATRHPSCGCHCGALGWSYLHD